MFFYCNLDEKESTCMICISMICKNDNDNDSAVAILTIDPSGSHNAPLRIQSLSWSKWKIKLPS